MIIKFNLKSNASNDKCGCSGDGNNPGGDPIGTSLVIEERRLNYALRRLLGFAERIMAMDDEDENKWTGMKGLMEMMERKFPQLINADSCLELDFEEVFYGQKTDFLGSFSFSQFTQALQSPEEMEKIHEYIVNNYELTAADHDRKETLRAEDKLLMLYSALRCELELHEDFESLFKKHEPQVQRANVVSMPHFGKGDTDRHQRHWETVYDRLVHQGWLDANEVSKPTWVYACCGQQEASVERIVWRHTTAALAHIVRTRFDGRWDVAHKIFCRPGGKGFPVSFNSTHSPAQKTVNAIDFIFSLD